MEPVSAWVKLERDTALLSDFLMKALRQGLRYRESDPVEQCRLGRLSLECLMLRRRLLEKRRGPKWKEEKQLQKMEKRVDKIMARLGVPSQKDDQTELTDARKELAEFQKQRNLIAHQ